MAGKLCSGRKHTPVVSRLKEWKRAREKRRRWRKRMERRRERILSQLVRIATGGNLVPGPEMRLKTVSGTEVVTTGPGEKLIPMVEFDKALDTGEGVMQIIEPSFIKAPIWVRLKNFWLHVKYPASYVDGVIVHEDWWLRVLRKIIRANYHRGE